MAESPLILLLDSFNHAGGEPNRRALNEKVNRRQSSSIPVLSLVRRHPCRDHFPQWREAAIITMIIITILDQTPSDWPYLSRGASPPS
ncbi:hypothetical protein BJX96DRAFT_31090 [Aspergillus floccosus]